MAQSPVTDASRQNSLNSNYMDISPNLLEAAAQASAAQESSEESGVDDDQTDPQKPEKRRKRARACVPCRSMKIRCVAVDNQEQCLACSKVNRECVMPGPAKKRQKTVHKVAELEKKINALTQSLLSKNQSEPTPQQSPAIIDGSRSAKESSKDSPEERPYPLFTKESPANIPPLRGQQPESTYEDVIDRGIVSFAMADRLFDKFMAEMNPMCPLIALDPSTNFENVRRRRPMLILAILASASPGLLPEAHEELTEELATQLGHRIYFLFERSLDLIQASLVLTAWAGKHKSAKDIGFNQYIHGAIVMAHDLGLSKRLKTPLTRNPAEEAEMRRTWLGCYYSGITVACTLRHPPMVRNTPYVQDCLKFLTTSPAALPTDITLCCMVRLIEVMEDVLTSFHMDDPASVVRLEDSSTQYSLKLFEKRLDDWRNEASKHLEPKRLEHLYAIATIYSHEIALHTDHNVDDFRPPAGRPGSAETETFTQDFITPSHLDALTRAVVAMRSTLDAFLAIFSASGNKTLPCMLIVWTAYAVVCMIRLDGALRASKSRYADVFLPYLNIEFYLDRIIERLGSSLVTGNSEPRPVSMFLHAFPKQKTAVTAPNAPVSMFFHAFQKLRVWYQYRLYGGAAPEHLGPDGMKPDIVGYAANKQDQMPRQGRNMSTSTASTPVAGNDMRGVENGTIGPGPAEIMRQQGMREQQTGTASQQYSGGPMTNSQGFDVYGGSWLTNATAPIDASMFENQDWNFTFEDWNNFEANMVQPAGGAWLGYLI